MDNGALTTHHARQTNKYIRGSIWRLLREARVLHRVVNRAPCMRSVLSREERILRRSERRENCLMIRKCNDWSCFFVLICRNIGRDLVYCCYRTSPSFHPDYDRNTWLYSGYRRILFFWLPFYHFPVDNRIIGAPSFYAVLSRTKVVGVLPRLSFRFG